MSVEAHFLPFFSGVSVFSGRKHARRVCALMGLLLTKIGTVGRSALSQCTVSFLFFGGKVSVTVCSKTHILRRHVHHTVLGCPVHEPE